MYRVALIWLLAASAWGACDQQPDGSWPTTCAALSWEAPTQNTDGSPLTDLAGYRVYRDCGSGQSVVADVPAPTQTWDDESPPIPAKCAYRLTAYNVALEESVQTNPVSKTFSATGVELPGVISATFSWSFQGPPDVALSDTGLVARYYLDEQASGITDGSTVVDASSNGYDLTINDGAGTTDLEYTEVSGNRGLDFKDTAGAQRVYRNIDNTSDAVRDAIDGTTQFTMELVVSLDAGNSNTARIFAVNDRLGGGPRIGITHNASIWRGWWNGAVFGDSWGTTTASRHVLHFVVDTTLAIDNRLQVYVDNSVVADNSTAPIGLNATVILPSNLDLIIGNRESSGSFARSFDGIVYYAALYSVAFDSTRVSDHYDVLVADDDTPSGATASLPINRSARMAVMIAH